MHILSYPTRSYATTTTQGGIIRKATKMYSSGNTMIREHFRADGGPKKAYDTWEDAYITAREMGIDFHGEYDAYECDFCGKFHIGSSK